ncbi:hypothetical protein ILUMI_12697 [Ignelater luminosus]|uniref:Uncharacterized protein n=1 Tax=Ignelater luminosus TaxID=2038154 RepID=A0A8K0CVY5_IGNLU|nr:hypothetical protein ILUMI_12697 [Ignelater luminosus]
MPVQSETEKSEPHQLGPGASSQSLAAYEKLKTLVEVSKTLKGRDVEKGNPRIILGRIDKELTQDRVMKLLARNNGDLVDACEGVKGFENQIKEKFRVGGTERGSTEGLIWSGKGFTRKTLYRRSNVINVKIMGTSQRTVRRGISYAVLR